MMAFIHEGWAAGWPERLGLVGSGLFIIGLTLVAFGFLARAWIDA